MRAYAIAGRPPVAATPFGSFELWAKTCRDPLLWLGLADPVASIEVMRATDQTLNNLAALAEAWLTAIGLGNPKSCAEVIVLAELRTTKGQRELFEALEPVAGDRVKLSAQRLGFFLGRMRGRRINGSWFDQAPQSYGTSRWQLLKQSR